MKKILLIVAISSLTFHLSPFTLRAQEGTLVDGVAAIVGKNIIKYSDIERSYAQMRLKSGLAMLMPTVVPSSRILSSRSCSCTKARLTVLR